MKRSCGLQNVLISLRPIVYAIGIYTAARIFSWHHPSAVVGTFCPAVSRDRMAIVSLTIHQQRFSDLFCFCRTLWSVHARHDINSSIFSTPKTVELHQLIRISSFVMPYILEISCCIHAQATQSITVHDPYLSYENRSISASKYRRISAFECYTRSISAFAESGPMVSLPQFILVGCARSGGSIVDIPPL